MSRGRGGILVILWVVQVCMMWLKTWIQKGVWGIKAWEMVLANQISTSTLMMERLIPPFLSGREAMLSVCCKKNFTFANDTTIPVDMQVQFRKKIMAVSKNIF